MSQQRQRRFKAATARSEAVGLFLTSVPFQRVPHLRLSIIF
jgi:hypothetical protein